MSDYEKVVDIIFGRWKSQILYAGVKLGVFDFVTPVPMSATEIARELGLDPALSYRLLRALGSIGLLKEHIDHRFSITSMGELLRRDNTQTLSGVALLEEGLNTMPSGSISQQWSRMVNKMDSFASLAKGYSIMHQYIHHTQTCSIKQ